MSGIFISYREDDAKAYALMLRAHLAAAFGDSEVFLDMETLHAGNWHDQIHKALDRCRVALVVIGPRWLTMEDERGARRLLKPDDVHREEIAIALRRKDINVIPVLVDDASMPRAADLPEDIRSLAEQQARRFSDTRARQEVDLKELIDDIHRVTGIRPRRPPRPRGGILRLLLLALLLSVILVTLLTVALDWELQAGEVGFLVLVVLLVAYVNYSRLTSPRRTDSPKNTDG